MGFIDWLSCSLEQGVESVPTTFRHCHIMGKIFLKEEFRRKEGEAVFGRCLGLGFPKSTS